MNVACTHCGASLEVEGEPADATCPYCARVTNVARIAERARQEQAQQDMTRKGTMVVAGSVVALVPLATMANCFCTQQPHPAGLPATDADAHHMARTIAAPPPPARR